MFARVRVSGERGQTAAEYLGMLFIVAVIVAAIASSDLGPMIDRAVSQQVCRVANDGGDDDCGAHAAARHDRARATARTRRPERSGRVIARAANVPCDGLTAKQCSVLRTLIMRAQAEHQQFLEKYYAFSAAFVNWVGAAERVKNIYDVVYRPNLFKAINLLLRKKVNREGARLLTSVKNQKLWNIVEHNYRYGATIGKGSTADALRDEVARGVPSKTVKATSSKPRTPSTA
jgi:pilus assembly protein Flp/PilA